MWETKTRKRNVEDLENEGPLRKKKSSVIDGKYSTTHHSCYYPLLFEIFSKGSLFQVFDLRFSGLCFPHPSKFCWHLTVSYHNSGLIKHGTFFSLTSSSSSWLFTWRLSFAAPGRLHLKIR